MTAPRVVVRYFADSPTSRWVRLGRTLAYSAEQHCVGWTHDIQQIDLTPIQSLTGRQGDVHNTRKLNAWADAVAHATDGDRLLLLDADTLIRRPLDDVWDLPFDLAYTTKPKGSRHPFNGGVIFLRVSAATQAFMATWQAVNRHLFTTPKDHEVWRPAFGGMNQSALGMLVLTADQQAWPERFKGYRHGLEVLRLPCLEWNCEDEHWDQFDPDRTRVVHYKSALQRALFGAAAESRTYGPLNEEWHAMEDAANAQTETAAMTDADANMQVRPETLTNPETAVRLSRRTRRRLAANAARDGDEVTHAER